MFVRQALGLFGRVRQHALALVRQRQVDRRRNLFADLHVTFDLLADGIDGGMGAEETIGESLVFPEQSEQQMLALDERTPKLASFVPCEKNHPPGLLRISLEHIK